MTLIIQKTKQIINTAYESVTPSHDLAEDIRKSKTEGTEAQLLWGEALIQNGYLKAGPEFIVLAACNAQDIQDDNQCEDMLIRAINIIKQGFTTPNSGETVMIPDHEKWLGLVLHQALEAFPESEDFLKEKAILNGEIEADDVKPDNQPSNWLFLRSFQI